MISSISSTTILRPTIFFSGLVLEHLLTTLLTSAIATSPSKTHSQGTLQMSCVGVVALATDQESIMRIATKVAGTRLIGGELHTILHERQTVSFPAEYPNIHTRTQSHLTLGKWYWNCLRWIKDENTVIYNI